MYRGITTKDYSKKDKKNMNISWQNKQRSIYYSRDGVNFNKVKIILIKVSFVFIAQ